MGKHRLNTGLVFFILLTILGTQLGASDKLTTVAVVDTEKVYLAYNEQSAPVREYNKLKAEFNEQKKILSNELIELNAAAVEAAKGGRNPDSIKAERLVQEKAKELTEYLQVKNLQLANLKSSLDGGDAFKRELFNAVEFIAISQGYTIVMQVSTDNTDVYWWSSEVDITSKVIDYLKKALR